MNQKSKRSLEKVSREFSIVRVENEKKEDRFLVDHEIITMSQLNYFLNSDWDIPIEGIKLISSIDKRMQSDFLIDAIINEIDKNQLTK